MPGQVSVQSIIEGTVCAAQGRTFQNEDSIGVRIPNIGDGAVEKGELIVLFSDFGSHLAESFHDQTRYLIRLNGFKQLKVFFRTEPVVRPLGILIQRVEEPFSKLTDFFPEIGEVVRIIR